MNTTSGFTLRSACIAALSVALVATFFVSGVVAPAHAVDVPESESLVELATATAGEPVTLQEDLVADASTSTEAPSPHTLAAEATALLGEFNVPTSWKSSTVCVGAYLELSGGDWELVSTDCGPKGSLFILENLEPEEYYYLRFVNANLASNQWDSYSGADWFWGEYQRGNTTYIGAVTPADTGDRWIPVYWFSDVDGSSPFYYEISWMGAWGLSTGYAGAEYRPSAGVSRQAMSAFMFRLWDELGFGEDFQAPSKAPFKDVPTSHPFYREISWMSADGISTGYGDKTYRPTAIVSRQAMSAFMYRLAGSPEFTPPSKSPFKDVPTSHPFYKEIAWMADQDISTGYGDNTFRPSAGVSRQAMSAFMFRFMWGE